MPQQSVKVVVLGDGGVGKSALTIRFVKGTFVESYDPTIEDSYRKQVDIMGHPVVLEILDTAGNDQFKLMRDLYLKNSEAFVVVYSVISKATFKDINETVESIQRAKAGEKVHIVLVGNKSDLASQRQVTTEEGQQLAEELHTLFIETSAKNNTGVDDIYTTVVKDLITSRVSSTKGDKKGKCTIC
eukprot:TRINITY_DN7139_c0_g1_i1.p1 TRINITY_DN7139_c0_g1~~TRINITY_DN7139_c0_g1_i1.p1  ORF type:complete len:205 (+),score=64.38 TRINITY_DN7139_c0_g1_i1:60-617(+)